ncbi:MAG: FtsH protease activity modulator HflK [candidate division Zixibacteria bacterium]|nr:FtsH protease activity modulator HflK [candidate division Zixibacteria bacterium]
MSNKLANKLPLIIALVILLIYLSTGLYTLESGQQSIKLRLGQFVSKSTNPGINYHLPYPFEGIRRVHVQKVQKVLLQDTTGTGIESFTGDENLIMVKAVVSYDVKDIENYIFNNQNPQGIIKSASITCLNNEIVELNVDDVMTTGKSVLRLVLKDKIQKMLDLLNVGVRIISVELTDITPPRNISDAFKAVSNARERKQRIIKEAEGYLNTIVPKARGQASSIISEAQAYSGETVNLANARVKAFSALNKEYVKNPSITAKIRYLETIQKIYQECNVTIDSDPIQSIYYIGKGEEVKSMNNKPSQQMKNPENSR